MKLYFAPGTCSQASHIALRELALPAELVRVNLRTKRTAEGGDFLEINPKGYVAALVLDDGKVLTEASAILQYIADQKPDGGLAPRHGTWERAKLQEWLGYVGGELHGSASPLFNAAMPDEAKTIFRDKLSKCLDIAAAALDGNEYLLGDQFSVADAYLFVVLSWFPRIGLDVARWPALAAFQARVAQRPAVKEAIAAEAASAEV